MPRRIHVVDQYPVAPEQVFEMLRQRSYHEQKYAYLRDLHTDLLLHETGDDSMDLLVARIARADYPQAAVRVLGDNLLEQRESWRWQADGLAGEILVAKEGNPITIEGRSGVQPAEHGCDWWVDVTVTARLKLVSRVVEATVDSQFRGMLAAERAFNAAWLDGRPPLTS